MVSPGAGLILGARTRCLHGTHKTLGRTSASALRRYFRLRLLCIAGLCFLVTGAAELIGLGTAVTEVSGGHPTSPTDYFSKLVILASNVYGEVKKAGPLLAERYDENLFNQSIFQDWLLRKVVYREDVPGPAPMSYKCGVYVNHHYKIIFIRNRKAASTTVLDTFKAACKSQETMCMRPFSAEEMKKRGLQHDDMWRSYYVISSTRNPWARAASGYDYTRDRWPEKTGVCEIVPFRQFCADPYLMGKMSNMFRCGAQGSFRGDDAWAYDFYHIEPSYHCMVDASGTGLSVDYLIRYEHLHEDFANLVDILNRRRDPSLPEIRGSRMRWRKQGVFVQEVRSRTQTGMWHEDAAALVSTDRHAVRYRECGMDCVRDIAAFFAKDIRLMNISVPAWA